MSIKKQYDDYSELSKLLYPSIEASGNIYYGQTRKLGLDSLFNINELGFDSHTENINDIPNLVWSLGAFKDRVPLYYREDQLSEGLVKIIDQYSDIEFTLRSLPYSTEAKPLDKYNEVYTLSEEESTGSYNAGLPLHYGTLFARYKINVENKSVDNILNSGNFKSYEKEVSCTFQDYVITNKHSPIDKEDYNIGRRHFIFDRDNMYLYIIISTKQSNEFYHLPVIEPLRITAIKGKSSIKVKGQYKSTYTNDDLLLFYRLNNNDYTKLELVNNITDNSITTIESEAISLNENDYVDFVTVNGLVPSFEITSDDNTAQVSASGNLVSILPQLDVSTPCIKATSGWSDLVYLGDRYYDFTNLRSNISYHDGKFYTRVILDDGTEDEVEDNELTVENILHLNRKCAQLESSPEVKFLDHMDENIWYDSFIAESDYKIKPRVITGLFKNCVLLEDASNLYFGLRSSVHDIYYAMKELFNGCTNLKNAPYLPYVYGGFKSTKIPIMFSGCSSLEKPPHLYFDSDISSDETFSDSLLINEIYAYSNDEQNMYLNFPWSRTGNATVYTNARLLKGYFPEGSNYKYIYKEYYFADSVYIVRLSNVRVNTVPSICTEDDPLFPETYSKFLTTSGYDGSLYSEYLNTYNKDGSFNQAVYGYKDFKSPIKASNGILFENSKLSDLSFETNISEDSRTYKASSKLVFNNESKYATASPSTILLQNQVESINTNNIKYKNSLQFYSNTSNKSNFISLESKNADNGMSGISLNSTNATISASKNGSTGIPVNASISVGSNSEIRMVSANDNNMQLVLINPETATFTGKIKSNELECTDISAPKLEVLDSNGDVKGTFSTDTRGLTLDSPLTMNKWLKVTEEVTAGGRFTSSDFTLTTPKDGDYVGSFLADNDYNAKFSTDLTIEGSLSTLETLWIQDHSIAQDVDNKNTLNIKYIDGSENAYPSNLTCNNITSTGTIKATEFEGRLPCLKDDYIPVGGIAVVAMSKQPIIGYQFCYESAIGWYRLGDTNKNPIYIKYCDFIGLTELKSTDVKADENGIIVVISGRRDAASNLGVPVLIQRIQ